MTKVYCQWGGGGGDVKTYFPKHCPQAAGLMTSLPWLLADINNHLVSRL